MLASVIGDGWGDRQETVEWRTSPCAGVKLALEEGFVPVLQLVSTGSNNITVVYLPTELCRFLIVHLHLDFGWQMEEVLQCCEGVV